MSETKRKFLVILGARPNFVKAAPFFKRAKDYPHLLFDLLHTGQHYDENMSKIFFDDMGIPTPNFHLNHQSDSTSTTLGLMLHSVSETVSAGSYEAIIVFGDIDSALLGAIAAAKAGSKIYHIEAGLRSHDKRMPEEKNRILIDHIADLLFTTEKTGNDNLKLEGVPTDRVHHVGNIMIESQELFKHLAQESTVLDEIGVSEKDYFAVTMHRIENIGDTDIFKKVLTVLEEISDQHQLVFPMHPGTKATIEKLGFNSLLASMNVIEPLGYFEFMKLIMASKGVITDSGGIQEETSHLGIPCATLRDNTERPVTVEQGTNKLFPIETLTAAAVLEHVTKTDFVPGAVPLWDGEVSKRIIDIIEQQ